MLLAKINADAKTDCINGDSPAVAFSDATGFDGFERVDYTTNCDLCGRDLHILVGKYDGLSYWRGNRRSTHRITYFTRASQLIRDAIE